jgi:hypothetical protein
MRDNMTTLLVVLLLLIAAFMMMGAVVAAASPALEATNDLDEVSELEIEDAVYSDGDEIPSSPSPASFGTSSSPPLGSSSSRPFVEPPIEHRGRLPNATGQGDDAGSGTGIGLNNTGPTTSTNITETTSTASFTAQPTTKTNGLLTASINGTRFTTNQTILVNGTVGEAAGSVLGLFVELKDPHNDMMAFDFTPIVRSDRPGADNETSFSYRLVAGDDGSSQDDSAGHNRRFWKPMNETGNNYTMTVGYATPAPSSPGPAAVAAGGGEYSRSEVQFVFAYDHLLPPGEEEAASVATTTTTTPAEEPEPEEEESDDDDDSGDDGEDSSSSGDDDDDDSSDDDDDDDSSSTSITSSSSRTSSRTSSSDDDDDSSSTSITSSSRTSTSSDDDDDDDEIDGNRISNIITNILDDVFDDVNNSNDRQ